MHPVAISATTAEPPESAARVDPARSHRVRSREIAHYDRKLPDRYAQIEAAALELSRRSVARKGQRVPVTVSEFRILEVLMSAPGRVFSRKELLMQL